MTSSLRSGLLGALLALSSVTDGLAAQAPLSEDEAFSPTLERTADLVVFHWAIAPDHYLYRDSISVRTPDGTDVEVATSTGWPHDDMSFGTVEVYRSETTASVPSGSLDGFGSFELSYRGCLEGSLCYPEIHRTFDVASLAPIETDTASPEDGPAPVVSVDRTPGIVDTLVDRGGIPLLVAGFLAFGLALAFTPCVLPMYPVVAAAVAGPGTNPSARRRLALGLAYVLAMSGAFSLLGVLVALGGQGSQTILRSPTALLASSTLLVLLALSAFGFFHLRAPTRWAAVAGGRRGGTLASAASLGALSALVVGPCVTAPLAGALLHVAHSGNVLVGASALFALGLGKGVPLLAFGVLGTSALPRSGPWLLATGRIFGIVLLGSALQVSSQLLPDAVVLVLWACLLTLAATICGIFRALPADASRASQAAKAAGFLLLVHAAALTVGAGAGGTDPFRPLATLVPGAGEWPHPASIPFEEVASMAELGQALATGDGGTVVYVTADWCTTCRSLERDVLSDPEVARAVGAHRTVEISLDRIDGPRRELMSALEIVGPPTFIFLDRGGVETPSSRLVGTMSREDVIRSARTVDGE